jgi:histidinol dehydrogenase
VTKGNKEHGILGGSAEILDRNLSIAAGFGVVCLKLRRSLNRVNLYVSGSRLDFLSVFLVEIA